MTDTWLGLWVHSYIVSSTPGKVALTNIILSDQCAISGASGSWIAPAGARRMPFKGRSRLQWFFQNSCRLELSVKASDHFSLFPCIPKQTPNVQCAICFCKYIVTFHFWQWTPVNPSDCNLSEKKNLSSNGIIYQWSKGRHHFVIFWCDKNSQTYCWNWFWDSVSNQVDTDCLFFKFEWNITIRTSFCKCFYFTPE